MKKGSIILAVFLTAELICLYQLGLLFPASIIDWFGTIRWGMLLYWIFHVTVIFIILYKFFLKDIVNYKILFVVIVTYLVVRVLYDFCIYMYLEHKTNSFLLTLSKISFISEIVLQLILLAILYLSAYLKGYHFLYSKKSVIFLACILVICIAYIRLNLNITNIFIEMRELSGKTTVSLESVLLAFSDNMIFEKLISFLTLLSVFWNLKKKDAISKLIYSKEC